MEENGKSKKRKIIDKLIMGAIIGGAIGSVVGLSIKNKRDKGKKLMEQNREKEGLTSAGDKKKNITLRILKKAVGVFARQKKEDVKKIPTETEN